MLRNGRVLPFSDRKAQQLNLAFRVVRKFVSQADPRLLWVKLSVGCDEIDAFRVANPGTIGLRSLMHVGHLPNAVCALQICGGLPANYLIGLMLHEFGHLGSGGGEREADRWIRDRFKIPIYYRSKLDIEWVSDRDMGRIARAGRSEIR